MENEKIPVELATVQYESHTQITEIAFRVYGGDRHFVRIEAAHDAMERYSEYFYETEGTVVSCDSYQCKQEFTPSGIPYVLFTFGNFQESF
jgi:bisphosphoglycerate-independent phosphoglycerate mutase (AlkP superfamily)